MSATARWTSALLGVCTALAVHAGPPARGLIVKLKDAPSHERALAAGAGAHPDAQRWQRVLADTGIAPRGMKPSGRAAQLLQFDRPLPGDEAARLALALRKRPEVEWVVPNTRERRLQSAIPPNDPQF